MNSISVIPQHIPFVMLPVTKNLIGIQRENWPDKAPFGFVVQHNGVFLELEGTFDSLDGALSIHHWDGEWIWGHLICSVFSRPAGDLCSKALPVKNKDITQLWPAGKKGALGLVWRGGGGSLRVTVPRKLTWQRSDSLLKSWLCCFCSSLFFHYLHLKCHHGLVLTKLSLSPDYLLQQKGNRKKSRL